MTDVMTVDVMHDVFAEKRRHAFAMILKFEEKAEKAITDGDRIAEALYRKFVMHWEQQYERISEKLGGIYKIDCTFKKEDWV